MPCRAAMRAAEHQSGLKSAEDQEAQRRKKFAEQLEILKQEGHEVTAQAEAEVKEQKATMTRLLACALGESLSAFETQAQQVHLLALPITLAYKLDGQMFLVPCNCCVTWQAYYFISWAVLAAHMRS